MFISGPYGFITVPRNVEKYQRVFVQVVFPTLRSRYRLTSTEGLTLEFHAREIKFFVSRVICETLLLKLKLGTLVMPFISWMKIFKWNVKVTLMGQRRLIMKLLSGSAPHFNPIRRSSTFLHNWPHCLLCVTPCTDVILVTSGRQLRSLLIC